MSEKRYDLEERTFIFARDCRRLIKSLTMDICNLEDGKQLVRSSGSVGSNYIEANEALSKKDFRYRIKVCRKESKESKYWIQLLESSNENIKDFSTLEKEADELIKIFSTILKNS